MKFKVGDKVKVKDLEHEKGFIIEARASEFTNKYKVAGEGIHYPKFWDEESLVVIQ